MIAGTTVAAIIAVSAEHRFTIRIGFSDHFRCMCHLVGLRFAIDVSHNSPDNLYFFPAHFSKNFSTASSL